MKKQIIIIALLFIIGLIAGYTLKPSEIVVIKDDSSKIDSVMTIINAQDTIIENLQIVIDSMYLESIKKEKNLIKVIKQRDEAIANIDNITDDQLQGYFTKRYGSISNE